MNAREWSRLAKNYHKEIVSPFYGDVENPLYDNLKKIKNKNKKSVAEFGCGLFYLGKRLAEDFKKVHASDFSLEMVKSARKRVKDYKNVSVRKEDLRKINYKNKFDVVISVNSIIMPSIKDRRKCFENVYNSLKENGNCLMILPAMEGVLYHGMLLVNENLGKSERFAIKSAKIRFEKRKYDLFLGLYKDNGETQKFYYKHEIKYSMKKVGFRDIKISKVKYPWSKEATDYEDFPDEERMWDWFVSARK